MNRFMVARNGDMWMAPFQCDYCWFININGREHVEGSLVDGRTLDYIRRINLDILWSREPGTVANNLREINKMRKLSQELNIPPWEPVMGPWPVRDEVGFRIAMCMLRASQKEGRNDKTYVQFDSVRKLRSAASNAYENSAGGNGHVLVFRGEKGKSYKLSHCETESRLFVKFNRGLELRMGRLVQSNMALDHRILLKICEHFDSDLSDPNVTWEVKRMHIILGAYLMCCFGASLRGNEGLYLEGSSVVDMINLGKEETEEEVGSGHVCLPLLGRFKSELGEDKHVAVLCNVSASGLKFRLWVERLVWLLIKEGKELDAGPAFCKEDGSMIRSYELDAKFHDILKVIQSERNDLIPEGIDVQAVYGTYRSCRRGSLTRATEQGVKGTDLDMVNRWRKFESSGGSKPRLSMREHYLEIKLVLKRNLAYSKAL